MEPAVKRYLQEKTVCHSEEHIVLGDGNADKEAEELLPSPNFWVHSCSKRIEGGEFVSIRVM